MFRSIVCPLMCLVFMVGIPSNAANCPAQEKSQDEVDKSDQENGLSVQDGIRKIQGLLREEKLDDAIDVLRKLAKSHPENVMLSVNLMGLLQRSGMQKAQESRSSGNELFYESAKVARLLQKQGGFPSEAKQLIQTSLYNEACTFAIEGKKAEALKSLESAFKSGFEDFQLASTDTDFGDLLKDEKFKSLIAKFKQKEISEQFKKFKTYDFDFELTDVKGKSLKKSDFKGKLLVVDIWGTWCGPCQRAVPSIVKLKQKYADKIEVVGLAYERVDDQDEAKSKVLEFMKEYKMGYRCALGTDEIKKQLPDLSGYPTTLFLDSEGKVRMELVDFQSFVELEKVILHMLDQ